MPRTARAKTGGIACHVTNRGNGRQKVFHDESDYDTFLALLANSFSRVPMRLLGFCLMPNHFHFVVWPRSDDDLGRWMQWLTTSHVRRHHNRHGGSGHVWQGRFKSFPVQQRPPTAAERAFGVIETENPVLAVLKYVERNPLRAGLVRRAEQWRFSSLRWTTGLEPCPQWLDASWLDRPQDWLIHVNAEENAEELAAVRLCVEQGIPFGHEAWVREMMARDV